MLLLYLNPLPEESPDLFRVSYLRCTASVAQIWLRRLCCTHATVHGLDSGSLSGMVNIMGACADKKWLSHHNSKGDAADWIDEEQLGAHAP